MILLAQISRLNKIKKFNIWLLLITLPGWICNCFDSATLILSCTRFQLPFFGFWSIFKQWCPKPGVLDFELKTHGRNEFYPSLSFVHENAPPHVFGMNKCPEKRK